MDAHQHELIAQFCGVTGANPSSAQSALASADWNLAEAVALYFAAQEEPQGHDDDDEMYEDDAPAHPPHQHQPQPREPAPPSASAPPPPSGGGRTLGGDGVASQPVAGNPAAQPTSSSSTARRNPPTGSSRMRTLRDLGRGGDDEEDDEEDKKQNMFAGGEKSGLAVQGPGPGAPRNHFEEIMRQARQNRDRPATADEDEEAQPAQTDRSSAFTGRAQTLGGDDAPSQILQDPHASRAQPGVAAGRLERISRTMHLWADGVSIDDGPLFRFDDPANVGMMEQINRGRAPLSLLEVAPDQEVDLTLEPHKDENYVKPTAKYKPFGGSGQRLGSPTPGAGGPSVTAGVASSAAPASGAESKAAEQQIDDTQPTLTLQIRLGDGTRLQSRFNTSHTIGDVYDFVGRASAASAGRSWSLMTTFPSKELEDKSQVLGEMSDFRRGGVVVQKWK